MSKKGRILVAMSGGIDSTVTAILLHEQGYEVVGVTLKTWDYISSNSTKKETGCCSLDSINDARNIAVKMGFHHFILDIREEFGEKIISNFVDEYMDGRTPNPCVLCNTHIKWEALLKRADALNCEYIATGHYAQLKNNNNRYYISKGVDFNKDQSYVLWGLSQSCLKRTFFPIGKYTKQETRQIAKEMGFERMSKKKESYDICFVPDGNYRDFIKNKVKNFDDKISEGNILDENNTVIGKHKGYPFYTIGQRKGLGIATGNPVYVTDINKKNNTITIGKKEDLNKTSAIIKDFNLLKYDNIKKNLPVKTKVRYKHQEQSSVINEQNNCIKVVFNEKVSGIAPGQSAVFYEGNDVVGGGIIM